MLSVYLVLLSSCQFQTVLLVNDPYIQLIDGDSWAPLSRLFRLRAWINGFKITKVTTDTDRNLKTVLSENSIPVDIVILSPWNAQSLNEVPEMEGRFIIAGGYPPASSPAWLESKLTALAPDRLSVMRELGKLASGYADAKGRPAFALFNTETDSRKKELAVLREVFDNSESLIVRDVNTGGGDTQIPSDYYQITDQSSILLLFAGTLNVEGLSSSDENSLPVITESIRDSGAWHGRIAASLEDNPKALEALLLSEMKSGSVEGVIYYPAKLSKGVLFGSVSR